MVSKTIKFPYCVSGRLAHSLVYAVNTLGCNVYFQKGERTVNACSIIGLLSLDIKNGDEIIIFINGHTDDEGASILKQFMKILDNLR